MKKFLIFILSFVLLFSITACGDLLNSNNESNNVENGNNNTEENNNSSNGGNSENNTENNNGNNTENNDETTENTYYEIKSASQFSDGVSVIRLCECEMLESGEHKFENTINSQYLLIDTSGNVLFSFTELGLDSNKFSQYKNGVAIYNGGDAFWGYTVKAVYDKSGNIVISPEKNGFDSVIAYSSDHKYFIVDKTEESFTGDKYMIGIIDNHGNYIEELSNTSVLGQLAQKTLEEGDRFKVEYVEDDIFYLKSDGGHVFNEQLGYYHVNTKKLTNNYNHIEWDLYGYLYKYDEFGNKIELFMDESIEEVFDNAVLLRGEYDYDKNIYTNYRLVDFEGNVLIDLSEYNLQRQSWVSSNEVGYYYENGYLLTQIKNPTGGVYCCLFDCNGDLVFDPIRMNGKDHFYHLNKLGFIYEEREDVYGAVGRYWIYKYDGTKEELKYAPNNLTDGSAYSFAEGLEVFDVNDEFVYINEKQEIIITGKIIKSKMN